MPMRIKVKPESLARVNTMRVDDHFLAREFVKPEKTYEVLEVKEELQMMTVWSYRSEEPVLVRKDASTVSYYVIMTEKSEEHEFLAEDFVIVG
ncbi:MAG: hypothetical protein ACLFTR_04945 [Candidatus Woesearchaeota archaeon]